MDLSNSSFNTGPPLTISDLHPPDPVDDSGGSSLMMEQRSQQLEPLPMGVTKKRRKKKTKRSDDSRNEDTQNLDVTTGSTINQMDDSYLNVLRARLDPITSSIPLQTPDESLTPLFTGMSAQTVVPFEESSLQNQTTVVGVKEHSEIPEREERPQGERRRRRTKRQSSRQASTEQPSDQISATQDEVTSEVRIESTPNITSNQENAALVDVRSTNEELQSDELQRQNLNIPTPDITTQSQPPDPMLLVDEEDIREGPVIITNQQGNTDETEQDKLTEVHTIYQQQPGTGGFIRLIQKEGGDKDTDSPFNGGDMTSSKFALTVHMFIRTTAIIGHGLLAGISLWDTAVAYSISQQTNGHVTLLEHYHPFPLGLHSVYLLLLSIVLVTILDRFDIARMNKSCIVKCCHSLSEIALAIALLLLILAYLVTTTEAFLDERITLFTKQPNLWLDVLTATNSSSPSITPLLTVSGLHYIANGQQSTRLTAWLALSVTRSICTCLSWFLAAWTLSADKLEKYLWNLNQTSSTDQDKPVIPPSLA